MGGRRDYQERLGLEGSTTVRVSPFWSRKAVDSGVPESWAVQESEGEVSRSDSFTWSNPFTEQIR